MESCTRIFSSTPRERWERWKEVTQIITRWKKNTWWSRSNNCPLKYDHFDPLPQVWKNGVKSVRFIHKRTEVLWFICSLDRSGTTGKGSQAPSSWIYFVMWCQNSEGVLFRNEVIWHVCSVCHLCDIVWRLNNVIYQELPNFLCNRIRGQTWLDGVVEYRGVIESRCWASSCFCCESAHTWQANRSRSLGASVYCVGVKDFNETQVCFLSIRFSLYLNVSWRLSFRKWNGS